MLSVYSINGGRIAALLAWSLPLAPAYADMWIAISSTMPAPSVRAYIQAANRIGAHVIIRGLVENDWEATATQFQRWLPAAARYGDTTYGAIEIDPPHFAAFAIKQVPTFVLASADEQHWDSLSGNISLQAALTHFAHRGTLPKLAQQYLKAFS